MEFKINISELSGCCIKGLFVAAISLSVISCDFLNVDESIGKSSDYMYGYFDEIDKVVAHIYAQMPDDWGTIDGALREAATDNAVYEWSDSKVYDMYFDSWDKTNPVDDVWDKYYAAIRSVNVYFRDFSSSRFDRFSHNNNIGEQLKVVKNYGYEIRVLRAFFYFELLKRYKNIPLANKVFDKDSLRFVKQAPFDEVVDFIVTECDSGIVNLPVSYADYYLVPETGRVTKGAAMALKARTLLYAASPLFNDGKDVEKKYEKAAEAAWALIDSVKTKQWYALVPSEQMWGNGNTALESKQLILEKRGGDSNDFEAKNFPIGYEGGMTGNCPSQNLVDAFEMADGSEFDWTNPSHAADPYAGRDPRLDQTVLRNGSVWQDRTVETFMYGRNGYPLQGASLTGYYLKKYVDESVSLSTVAIVKKPHHYILFRYAEVLLNYAEAMTEWKGHTYKDSKYTMSAVEAVNEVRARVGMQPIPASLNKDDFVKKYRNERRIELAFEDHRFWDIRRWMIGPETTKIYGVKTTKNEDGTFRYEKVLIQDRVWKDKMYLYPISQTEMLKNTDWKQNPGW